MEELNYPELPEGYVWKKRGEESLSRDPDDDLDVKILVQGPGNLHQVLVAWVSDTNGDFDSEMGIWAQNRDQDSGDHGLATQVSSFQEGINLIHAQLMLGLIGKGKCLQE